MSDTIRVVSVLPDLLGTYGDSGNAIVASKRLALRGYQVELINAGLKDGIPSGGDFYFVGGGEDGPQSKAAELLRVDAVVERALESGAGLLAVCAGFQILGESFIGPNLKPQAGIGLFSCRTHRFDGPRSVGELIVEPVGSLAGLPLLTGYENHQGVTELLPGAVPLGGVLVGNGNNFEGRSDGAVLGRAIGTYMHGPVFARNPALCDHFLSLVLGELAPLGAIPLEEAHRALYDERISEVYRP